MRRSLTAFAAGLAAVSSVAAGNELACGTEASAIPPFRLEFSVTASRGPISLSGDGLVVYRRSGNSYNLQSSVTALGVLEARQNSVGTIGPQGLVPRSFTHQAGRRPMRSVDIDWAAQRVTFGPAGTEEPTRPQLQDRLSLLVQLPWIQRADPRVRGFAFPVAGRTRISEYHFVARDSEVVDLPAGRFDTVKFEREGADGKDRVEVWLAPKLCSLPVRVRYANDEGLVVDQQLRAVRPPAP